MADVISYASTGNVVYKNGTIITMADKLGNVKVVNAEVEHNQIASQSGILDSRNDDITYYTT